MCCHFRVNILEMIALITEILCKKNKRNKNEMSEQAHKSEGWEGIVESETLAKNDHIKIYIMTQSVFQQCWRLFQISNNWQRLLIQTNRCSNAAANMQYVRPLLYSITNFQETFDVIYSNRLIPSF